jgi:hypothetical protein
MPIQEQLLPAPDEYDPSKIRLEAALSEICCTHRAFW